MHSYETQAALEPHRTIGTGPVTHPATRGYHVMYRAGGANACPGCGGSHWHVGRVTAECANCLTALPIQQQQGCDGVGLFASRGHDGSDDILAFAVA